MKRTVLAKAEIRYIEVPGEMSNRQGQLDAHLRAELGVWEQVNGKPI